MKTIICPRCETELQTLSNFCPNCGGSLHIVAKSAPTITPVRFFILVLASLGLFLFGWITQSTLSGKKPDKMFTASASTNESTKPENVAEVDYNDPEIEKVRQHAKEKPLDVDLQKQFSKLLIQKIRNYETPPQGLVFETIDTLRNILNLNPEDPDALIAMADISFDQQAFAKAIEFYKKYLEVEKTDLNARSRYASSLTFVGKHEEALAELDSVLKIDPKNFHAHAYTAIAYAQMGKVSEAKKFGQQALDVAPSPEAKKRFSQFLAQLDTQGEIPHSSSPARDNTKSEAALKDGPIVEYVKNNQIAGPKYESYELTESNELVLNFKNFPMQAMPPFAKEKFFSSLKEATKSESSKPSKIIFRDAQTGQDLDILILN